MKCGFKYLGSLLLFSALTTPCSAVNYNVVNNADTGPGSLRLAFQNVITTPAATNTINITIPAGSTTITLGNNMIPLLNFAAGTTTIQNSGSISKPVIDGAGLYQALFNYRGNLVVNDVTIQNTKAKGGTGSNGGGGGGGGAGMGGGLFVKAGNTVTLTNVAFSSNTAEGGTGGNGNDGNGGGGGGGIFGSGGVRLNGGAGGGGQYSNGGNGFSGGGGGGGIFFPGGNSNPFGGGGGGGLSGPGDPSVSDVGGAGGTNGGGGGGGKGGDAPLGAGSAAGLGSPPGSDGQAGSNATNTNGGNGGAGGAAGAFGGGGGGGLGGDETTGTGGNGGNGGNGFALGGNGFSDGGGGGGGGLSTAFGGNGGNAGFGGGGGGGGASTLTGSNGGAGGFGGGGGGGAEGGDGNGGAGGFGGGGGGQGFFGTSGGQGGAFAGNGGGTGQQGSTGGGGGAGLGGAIFLQFDPNTMQGADLRIHDGCSFSGNLATGGSGGTGTLSGGSGQGRGNDIFMMAGSSITFNINSALTIPTPIESDNESSTLGGLFKNGTGTLTLLGTPLTQGYIGGTFLNGGVISIEQDATLGRDALFFNGGTLQWTANTTSNRAITIQGGGATFDTLGNTDTLAGNIQGVGGLTKIGAGTLFLTGSSIYSGPTQVNAGTFVMNGSITSPTTVAAGATLKGTGTISNSLNVFGTVRPGNSVGTLTVAGPVTFNAGSTYVEEISPVQASLLNVTAGGVTIDPGVTLSIIVDPGTYTLGTTYTIIQTTGGVTGTFSNVIDNAPLLDFIVLYPGNLVQLVVDKRANAFTLLVPNGNAGAVAACLNSALPTPGTDFNFVINQLLFVPNAKVLQHALNQMQPSQYNAFQLTQENNNTRVLSVLSGRAEQLHRSCKPQEQTWGVWFDAYGDFLNQEHQHGQYGFHAATGAALTGIDGHATPHLHLGLGGAYTWTHLNWAGSHGNSQISSGYGFAYGTWNVRHFFLDASFVGGYNSYEAKRHVGFLAIDRRAKSNHHGYTLAGRLTGGFPFKVWKAEVAPLFSLDYDFLHQSGFKEHGAESLNLHVHKKNANLLRAEAGFRVTRRCPLELMVDPCTGNEICGSDVRFLPSFQLTVIREWRFEGERYRSRLQDLDCTFTTKGLNPDRTLISPAVGMTWLLYDDRISLTLDYAGEFAFGGKFCDQKGNFQISYAF